MATRILVKCTSETIPGKAIDRNETIANIVCQHRLGRDFNRTTDYLLCSGHYYFDHRRCRFLIDVGPHGSQNPAIFYFRWNGEALCEQRVTEPLIRHLTNTYPFNPHPSEVESYTDEELRARFGEEVYRNSLVGRSKVKVKLGMELSCEEKRLLEEHPELHTELDT